jgi:hypothetical protein
VSLGSADIFFPTDFVMLAHMYREVAASNGVALGSGDRSAPGAAATPASASASAGQQQPLAKILSHSEFVQLYGSLAATQTRTDYNPMCDDFGNASVPLASSPLAQST